MANTFRKIYKRTGSSGTAADYQLVGNVGVDGVELDIMKGASSSTDGELGLVPKPTKEKYNFVLKANGIWDCIYPVGSIYFSVNNVNPSEYFGGTWVAWGSGRVPVGVNVSDSNFNSVEKTGGESRHTLTINEMPEHNHLSAPEQEIEGLYMVSPHRYEGSLSESSPSGGYRVNSNCTIKSNGGGQPHNNLQPYITCYMWKRTA